MNTMAKWNKTSPWGDYKDFLQNHKFDDQLIFNPNTNKLEVFNRNGNILHEAKWYFGKHIGSKKLANVMYINKKANTKRALIKKAIKESEENAGNNASKQ